MINFFNNLGSSQLEKTPKHKSKNLKNDWTLEKNPT